MTLRLIYDQNLKTTFRNKSIRRLNGSYGRDQIEVSIPERLGDLLGMDEAKIRGGNRTNQKFMEGHEKLQIEA